MKASFVDWIKEVTASGERWIEINCDNGHYLISVEDNENNGRDFGGETLESAIYNALKNWKS